MRNRFLRFGLSVVLSAVFACSAAEGAADHSVVEPGQLAFHWRRDVGDAFPRYPIPLLADGAAPVCAVAAYSIEADGKVGFVKMLRTAMRRGRLSRQQQASIEGSVGAYLAGFHFVPATDAKELPVFTRERVIVFMLASDAKVPGRVAAIASRCAVGSLVDELAGHASPPVDGGVVEEPLLVTGSLIPAGITIGP